ncbi:hypothetical protein RRG08_019080 [Elysia crispata]|uniref:Uncharacterized protein n=1 Tax=Elysia crispata TaxID=231223 RepID=A0AAE1DT83_9GAST|nr:hypothetical protein RRG08_019080 [Elysia crispata]
MSIASHVNIFSFKKPDNLKFNAGTEKREVEALVAPDIGSAVNGCTTKCDALFDQIKCEIENTVSHTATIRVPMPTLMPLASTLCTPTLEACRNNVEILVPGLIELGLDTFAKTEMSGFVVKAKRQKLHRSREDQVTYISQKIEDEFQDKRHTIEIWIDNRKSVRQSVEEWA